MMIDIAEREVKEQQVLIRRECSIKLQQREEDEKEFLEKIKRFEEKVRDNHFILTEEMLEELKNEN